MSIDSAFCLIQEAQNFLAKLRADLAGESNSEDVLRVIGAIESAEVMTQEIGKSLVDKLGIDPAPALSEGFCTRPYAYDSRGTIRSRSFTPLDEAEANLSLV